MNLVYFGSPAFAATILESIIQNFPPNEGGNKKGVNFRIAAVVTQPDAPSPSPVAFLAGKYSLPVFKPAKLDEANLSHLKLLKPDVFLVVSYGKIIPKNWLSAPSIGTFNLHFSLLPKYRGALCISEAIRNQDEQTGVTLMVMDEGLDTGPIIYQSKVDIDINDDCASMTTKLTQAAISLLHSQLSLPAGRHGILHFPFSSIPQDNSKATITPFKKTRNRQSAYIPWSEIKLSIVNSQLSLNMHALIRSLNPDPGAWTIVKCKMDNGQFKNLELKILKTSFSILHSQFSIDFVQLPGKKPITWKEFIAGHQIV